VVLHDLADDLLLDLAVAYCFHHGEMLEIIVRLEESVTSKELDEDASYTPNVARITPAQLQDYFGGAVMSS